MNSPGGDPEGGGGGDRRSAKTAKTPRIAVIGGGPAGLRAAEVAAEGGAAVTLYEAKPSVGRKFLVAGRGGLNLTKTEPRERFVTRYTGPDIPTEGGPWPSLLDGFDADRLRAWASGLGIETFAASTGRVYPRGLKAAPLLRRWVERLRSLGVEFAMHHRLTGLGRGAPLQLEFTVNGQQKSVDPDAAVLALGGGSWPETGSDGRWMALLERLGITVAPLEPANSGWECPWPPSVLALAEGKPLKNVVARAGGSEAAGELLITAYGLEGGALYQLGPALRALSALSPSSAPEFAIDFKPAATVEQLVAKLGPVRRNFLAEARTRWRLGDGAFAILASREPYRSAEALALETKHCRLPLSKPRPLAEAISSAGGVRWAELDAGLMLERLPGLFVAGEMIDWEAPTGGYLIQGCFATGTRAGRSALEFVRRGG